MLRTILFFITLCITLIISLFFLIPLLVFKLTGSRETKNNYVRIVTSEWSKLILFIFRVRVKHNIVNSFPSTCYVIVSNHQGYFDIPVIVSIIPVSPAFISKMELKRTPILSIWMEALECLFINRSDSKGSRKKILERLQDKGQNPLLLFPEGTRSRSSKLLPFRTGGLKMVFDSGIDVLPLRISNTYRIWEEKNRILPGEVKVEIRPVINTINYKETGFSAFIKEIRKTLTPDSGS